LDTALLEKVTGRHGLAKEVSAVNISTNLDELEKLLSLATNQTKQLQETLKQISEYELVSKIESRE
jgi:hypothetical protein